MAAVSGDSGPITHGPTARPARNGCNPGDATSVRHLRWSDVREHLGLSIREMAEATGINRGDLSKIERGQACPTPYQAAQILALRKRP